MTGSQDSWVLRLPGGGTHFKRGMRLLLCTVLYESLRHAGDTRLQPARAETVLEGTGVKWDPAGATTPTLHCPKLRPVQENPSCSLCGQGMDYREEQELSAVCCNPSSPISHLCCFIPLCPAPSIQCPLSLPFNLHFTDPLQRKPYCLLSSH